MHNRKLILIVGILAFFLLDIWILKLILPKTSSLHRISITSNGYSPRTITVSAGDTIEFVNEDTQNHWPASNDHPSHQLYPAFDSKRPVLPHKSWKFVINRTGTWKYHDHLHPALSGTITVIGVTKSEGDASQNNIMEHVNTIVKTQGSVKAMEYLIQNYNASTPGIHDVAHYVGSLIYREYSSKGIAYCDDSFAFGCFHGVTEKAIEIKGPDEIKNILSLCETFSPERLATCYHGIGHGILPYHKYNLAPALEACDDYIAKENARYCYNGVFMENALVLTDEATKDNPQWPCNTVKDEYKDSCYQYQMIFLGKIYSNNTEQMAAVCQNAPDEYVTTCLRGIVQQFTQRYITNIPKIKQECDQLNAFKSDCYTIAATELVFQRQPIETIKKAFCNELTNKNKTQCIDKIELQKNLQ